MAEQTVLTLGPEQYKLPEGWKWVKLGDVLTRKPQYGLTARSSEEEKEVRYIRISDITNAGELRDDDLRFLDLGEEEFKKYKLEEDDLLIARSGTIGRVYLHKPLKRKAVFASYLIRFKLDSSRVIPKFFFYYGLSPFYKKWVEGTLRIVAQPNINAKRYCGLGFPLPPLEEQRRIANRIEQLMSRVEEAKRLRKQAREEAERIMQAALHQVFSRAEEEGWRWVRLEETLIRKPQYGLTAKSSREKKRFQYIRISDITDDGELKSDDPRFVDLNKSEFEKYKLEENDILIARSGTIGRIYLHKSLKQKSVFASYLIRFKLDSNKIMPKFFFYYGLSPFYRKWVDGTLRIVAQPNINAKRYSKLKIPLPPLMEQKKIVIYLDQARKIAESLKKLQQKTGEELEKLVPAILDKAFRGEL